MGYVGTKPADAALTSADIADGVVTADKLATDAVETAKVKDLNVTVMQNYRLQLIYLPKR